MATKPVPHPPASRAVLTATPPLAARLARRSSLTLGQQADLLKYRKALKQGE